jgi:pimeloyl-ACP methyl ester carboxylesterase
METPVGFTHHRLQVGDVRLHYLKGGEGDAVMLVHGWPQNWSEWRHVMPRLAEHFTVVVPDCRGMGWSSKPMTGYDQDSMAEDLFGLATALGHDRIHFVGHDWGAVWGYAYAALHRNAVRRLVTLDMMIPGTGHHEAGMVPTPHGEFFWHMGFQSVPEVPEEIIRGNEAIYMTLNYESYAYDPSAISWPETRVYIEPMRDHIGALRAGLHIYQQFFTDAEQTERHLAAGKLDIPVLALGGEACVGPFMKASMEVLADDVRGGVIERCGHWIPEERPEWLADQLIEFLTEGK